MLRALILGLAAVLLMVPVVRAQGAANDKVFADRAYAAGLTAIAESRIAVAKSANDKVVKFARRLVEDRAAANDELVDIAKAEGLVLPTLPAEGQRAQIARLGKLAGNDFDQAYLSGQVADGETAVALYVSETEQGSDPLLKQTAARAVPILNDHVQVAKSLAAVR